MLLCIITDYASASFIQCNPVEAPPRCYIDGFTSYSSCNYKISDTSSWSIPIAHDGICWESIILSNTEKERIYKEIDNFFKQNNFIDLKRSAYYTPWYVLNYAGQSVVLNIYFPLIKKYILEEKWKTNPDRKKLAIVYYMSEIIGYDFYIYQNIK